eukprot:6657546-Prorocentrum_lima.AAC.1
MKGPSGQARLLARKSQHQAKQDESSPKPRVSAGSAIKRPGTRSKQPKLSRGCQISTVEHEEQQVAQ